MTPTRVSLSTTGTSEVARGWTQRELAEALGVAEQRIQHYEANDYRSTSLARLCDIADALSVTVAQRAELKPSAAGVGSARQRRICTVHVPTQR